jgi:cytochrome c oxidase subunit 2
MVRAVKLRTLALSGLVCLSVLAISSCDGGGPAAPSDPVLAEGQRVYNSRCSSCHGKSGNGGSAPKLKDVIADRYSVEQHTAIVVNGAGGGRMPAFGKELTPEEIDAVVRYEREGL